MAKAKSNSVITTTVDGSEITFNVLGGGTLKLDVEQQLHPAIVQHAAIHGIIQRVSDAAAIGRNPETGKSATPQEKFDAMRRLVEHYATGTDQWALAREAGEGRVSYARAAIAEYLGVDVKEVDVRLEKLAAKKQMKKVDVAKLIGALPKVKEIIERMRAERISQDDLDVAEGMLDELGAE